MSDERQKESPKETEDFEAEDRPVNSTSNQPSLPKGYEQVRPLSFGETQVEVNKIANAVAIQKFNLIPEKDYVFYFMKDVQYSYRIQAGPLPRIEFAVDPRQPDFIPAIFACFQQLINNHKIKQGKAIELRSRIEAGQSYVKSLSPDIDTLNGQMVPRGDCAVEYYRVVRVVHKPTGIVITREANGSIGNARDWSSMIDDARRELRGMTNITGYTKAGGFKNPTGKRGLRKLERLGD